MCIEVSWETYGNLLHLLHSRFPPSGVMVASPQCPSRWIRVSFVAKALQKPFHQLQFWRFYLVFHLFFPWFSHGKRHGSIVLRFSTSVGASSVEEERLGSHGNTKREARDGNLRRSSKHLFHFRIRWFYVHFMSISLSSGLASGTTTQSGARRPAKDQSDAPISTALSSTASVVGTGMIRCAKLRQPICIYLP